MIYLIFLFLSCLYLSKLKNYRQCSYLKLVGYSFPIIIFWILIVGCQYGIGTDYFSYVEIFRGKNFNYISNIRGEYAFAAIAKLVFISGFPAQSGFIIISIIEVLLLFYIMHKCVATQYAFMFFFVFICFCGTFHNQMNGIRQYLAIYLVSVIVCLICNSKFTSALIISILTYFIHKSSAIIIPAIVLIYIFRYKDDTNLLYSVIFCGALFSIILSNTIIEKIIPYFEMYSHYLETDKIDNYGIIQKMTKYVYIPPLLLAIYKYPKMNLCPVHRSLFVFGIYGFAMKLSVMSFSTVSRIGLYLEIISCVPLVYLLIYFYRKYQLKQYAFLVAYLLTPYIIKVVVLKTGEYGFDSIFLH